jgi:hypothetical protein
MTPPRVRVARAAIIAVLVNIIISSGGGAKGWTWGKERGVQIRGLSMAVFYTAGMLAGVEF